jgi:hypothetical protein
VPEGKTPEREQTMELDMAKNAGNINTVRGGVGQGQEINRLSKDEAGSRVFVRILIILVVDIIVSSLFETVRPHQNVGSDAMTVFIKMRPVLVWVFGALLAAAAVYWIVTLIFRIDTSAHWVTPAMLFMVALYLFVSVFNYTWNTFWRFPPLFYVMTVIVSVLFAVYYIYTIILYRK